jgi:hypothetical protein
VGAYQGRGWNHLVMILRSYDIDSPQLGRSFKVDLAEGLDVAHLDFIGTQWAAYGAKCSTEKCA